MLLALDLYVNRWAEQEEDTHTLISAVGFHDLLCIYTLGSIYLAFTLLCCEPDLARSEICSYLAVNLREQIPI